MDFRFDSVEKVLATGDRTFVKAPLGGGSSSLLPLNLEQKKISASARLRVPNKKRKLHFT